MAVPSDPPPPLLVRGVELFNSREYFDQHEVLEELWRAEPGPIRELYQGILQVGVGLLHLERSNHHGALTLLGRGLTRLARVPPDSHGLDVATLIADGTRLRERIVALGPTRLTEVRPDEHPRVRWLRPPSWAP